VGFCFSKYITFRHSKLETTRQAFRYAAILGCNWLITYISLKLLVEMAGIYPTPAKMITTVITTLLGFILQKYYSFKSSK
jgi:putative flippase GtrA